MLNRNILDEEENKRVASLTAGQASVPQYTALQAKGVEAAGDIFGITTPGVSSFRETQEAKLSGFKPKYPERLLETPEPFEWWKEKASLNAMNTVAPMMGFALGSILTAIPHPYAKALGTLVNTVTYAATYNANFADTLDEHEQLAERELSVGEKAKAAVVAAAVTALDLIAPLKGAKATSGAFLKTFGKGGVTDASKKLTKLVNTTRASLLKQVQTGAAFGGKLIGTEMATEAAQKALQIGTSVQPGRLGTSEGLQDMLEEAVIAGPTVGIVGAPGIVGQARAQNRDLGTARRLAQGFNLKQLRDAPETSTAPIEFIDIPEGRGYTPGVQQTFKEGFEALKNISGIDLPKMVKGAAVGSIFKPLQPLLAKRDAAKTGKAFHAIDNLIQKFTPAESLSGDVGKGKNFEGLKAVKMGEYMKDVDDILVKYSSKHRLMGRFGQVLDANVNEYITKTLRGETEGMAALEKTLRDGGVDMTELVKDVSIIKQAQDRVHKDLTSAIGDIGYIDNYLHLPLLTEEINKRFDEFVKNILESSNKAFGKGEVTEALTSKQANTLARKIVENVDTQVESIREREAKTADKERGLPKDFEKSRNKHLAYIDNSFRNTNLSSALTGYFSKAATRYASAEVFGPDAWKLKEDLVAGIEEEVLEPEDVNRVYDLYDAVHNVYKKDVSGVETEFRKVSKIGTTIGAITHLGLATISSLPELIWIGERAGFGNMLLTLPSALKYATQGIRRGSSGKYIKPGEGAQALAILGFNLSPELNERLEQLFATDRNKILNSYFRSPFGGFLTQYTNFTRNWAAQAMISNINRRANGIISGDLSDIERRRLNNELTENGVSMEQFKSITDIAINEHGKVRIDILNDEYLNTVVDTRINRRKNLETGKIEEIQEDVRVRDILVPWIHKVVDEIVVNPRATNKPLWMSNPSLAMIAQLKTFPIVFGNTVMKRILRKLNPKQCSPDFGLAVSAIGAIAAAYAVTHIGEMLKDSIRQQDYETPGFIESLDRAGITGGFGLIFGSGKGYDGAVTSLLGTGAGFVNTLFSEMLTPLYSDDGKLIEIPGNLIEWIGSATDSSLGAAGIYFKPFEDEE